MRRPVCLRAWSDPTGVPPDRARPQGGPHSCQPHAHSQVGPVPGQVWPPPGTLQQLFPGVSVEAALIHPNSTPRTLSVAGRQAYGRRVTRRRSSSARWPPGAAHPGRPRMEDDTVMSAGRRAYSPPASSRSSEDHLRLNAIGRDGSPRASRHNDRVSAVQSGFLDGRGVRWKPMIALFGRQDWGPSPWRRITSSESARIGGGVAHP
jgi:hypothetical protein